MLPRYRLDLPAFAEPTGAGPTADTALIVSKKKADPFVQRRLFPSAISTRMFFENGLWKGTHTGF
jgi:hypothetical protein